MRLGRQHYFCANCGRRQYDNRLDMTHVMSMLCSDTCRREYEMKYARMILGKDGETGYTETETERQT